jgi:hypothetical protein
MVQYKVMVDDNFHYDEPDERRTDGVFATLDEALAVCRRLVDQSLDSLKTPGMTAEKLYDSYMSFGDDPFVVVVGGTDEHAKFSAWSYAKERCSVLCNG